LFENSNKDGVIKFKNWFINNATAIGVIFSIVFSTVSLIYTIDNSNKQFELFKEEYNKTYGDPVIEIYSDFIRMNLNWKRLKQLRYKSSI